jgi:hypothetical protein
MWNNKAYKARHQRCDMFITGRRHHKHDPTNASGIVYNSGVVIENAGLLTTLTALYEQVYLPHFDLKEGLYWSSMHDGAEEAARGFMQWQSKWKPLFEEKVLIQLPMADAVCDADHEIAQQIYFNIFDIENEMRTRSLNWLTLYLLQLHLVRRDISLPRIFDISNKPNRHNLVALEAFATFQYFLPKLQPLEPEEILELRNKIKDTREGFAMHLQKLSKELDGVVKSGARLQELAEHAKAIVDTDLIPDYIEFRRQLEAEKAGKWKKALETTGKIMAIDAAPWTPKFWGELLKALGVSAIETAADQKEWVTNRYQAFEFISEIENLYQRKHDKKIGYA